MRGFAFFGVPHQGMNIQSLVSMAGHVMNPRLIQSIELGRSDLLEDMAEKFSKVLDNNSEVEIFSFYETNESPMAQMVFKPYPFCIFACLQGQGRGMGHDQTESDYCTEVVSNAWPSIEE